MSSLIPVDRDWLIWAVLLGAAAFGIRRDYGIGDRLGATG